MTFIACCPTSHDAGTTHSQIFLGGLHLPHVSLLSFLVIVPAVFRSFQFPSVHHASSCKPCLLLLIYSSSDPYLTLMRLPRELSTPANFMHLICHTLHWLLREWPPHLQSTNGCKRCLNLVRRNTSLTEILDNSILTTLRYEHCSYCCYGCKCIDHNNCIILITAIITMYNNGSSCFYPFKLKTWYSKYDDIYFSCVEE